MLYPITNQYRTVISLNGIWNFEFVSEKYNAERPLSTHRLMSVPSSYNDIGVTSEFRDYVGVVAYEKKICLPKLLSSEIIRLRIGSASHQTKVYVDGQFAGHHKGGFLPIDLDLTSFIQPGIESRLTILVDNRLDFQSFPMGELIQKENETKQVINYDFFNYSGIHRDVCIYSVPKNAIEDIVIDSVVTSGSATVSYSLKTSDMFVKAEMMDPNGNLVARSTKLNQSFDIKDPILWGIGKGNLYSLKITTQNDEYVQKFGIRSVEIKGNKLLLNGEAIFLKGFGKHEDFFVSGKGNNSAVNIRDFELLKWIHANSFRTSHYPYAEEIYDLADEYGVLIIDELPAVGFNFWSGRAVYTEDVANQKTLEEHKKEVKELIERDKNHPSVIMISLANEANTNEENAYPYYKSLIEYTKTLTKLPIMVVEWVMPKDNKIGDLVDVIGVNRYIGWYTDFADLNVVESQLTSLLTDYHQKFNKPILLSEFGADTQSGFHHLPSLAFTEEFQLDFIEKYLNVISKLEFIIGEHVWNFADFMTKQGLTRFIGNRKGVFTRDRQPKMVAHFLRKHWED